MTYVKYWNDSTPMSFATEKWPYKKKRAFRYELQSYMLDTFKFERFAGKRVLEIGCGSGIDSLELASHGAKVTATDMTDNAIKLTYELSQEAALPISVRKAVGTTLPFPDGTFDVVYSYGVIHHIPEVRKVLKEIHRVLTPEGLFLGMVYNMNSLLYEYSILHLHEDELLSDTELTSKYSERNVGCPYTKVYTEQELKELLSSYFASTNTCVRYNVIDLPTQRKVKLNLPEGHPQGWHIIFEATK